MLLANRKNQLNSNKDTHHFLKEDVIERKMVEEQRLFNRVTCK